MSLGQGIPLRTDPYAMDAPVYGVRKLLTSATEIRCDTCQQPSGVWSLPPHPRYVMCPDCTNRDRLVRQRELIRRTIDGLGLEVASETLDLGWEPCNANDN